MTRLKTAQIKREQLINLKVNRLLTTSNILFNKDNQMYTSVTQKMIAYQKGKIFRREFISAINHIILSIPAYFGCYDEEIKSEFYAHTISIIDKKIAAYKVYKNVKAETWLTCVLKNDFRLFIKKYYKNIKKEEIILTEVISQEEFTNPEYYDQETQDNPYIAIIKEGLSHLTFREKSVYAIKYGIDIDGIDIKKSLEQIASRLDKRKKINEIINKKYIKLINLQKSYNDENDPELLLLLNKKCNKIKISLDRNRRTYNHYSIFPTNQWVGLQLGLAGNTIAVFLYKIKKKLHTFFETNYPYILNQTIFIK